MTDQTCLNEDCHNYDEMIANIPDDKLLVDANGTTVNPHEIHNVGTSHGDIKCSDCHLTHKEGRPIKQPPTSASAATTRTFTSAVPATRRLHESLKRSA